MSGNSANILAGIGSTTAVGDLAFFAVVDTAGPVAVTFTAEVQTATISGTPTGGTFTLTWQGIPTSAQAYNVPTATLATQLNTAWSSKLHGGTITVTGSAGTSYVITFPATLGNVALITAVGAFTGGSSPAIAVVETTPGAGANLATASIPVAFTTAGYCTTDGLTPNVNETVNTVKGYGTTATLRTIIQSSERSFDVAFLEVNAISQSVYNRLALGTIVPDANGYFTYAVGGPLNQTYAAIFDVVDGFNHIRSYCPRVQVSAIKSATVSAGKEITWPVTLTALPDATGNAVYNYVVVDALHA